MPADMVNHGQMRRFTYMLIATLAGCGPAGDSSDCQPQNGAYLIHFVERAGGSCGPRTDQIYGFDTTRGTIGLLALGCNGQDNETMDHCTETIQVSCLTANGGTGTIGGAINYSANAASGSGVLEIQIFDAADRLLCGSVYDVEITRQ